MKMSKKLFLALGFLVVTILPFLLVSTPSHAACGFADFGENTVLDSTFRGTNYSSATPANYYVALYTTACSDTAGTEVSTTSTGYARVAIARTSGAWNATNGTNGLISNIGAITFSQALLDWGTVQSWCLLDTASGAANAIVCANLTASRNITAGSTPSYAAGAMTITLD